MAYAYKSGRNVIYKGQYYSKSQTLNNIKSLISSKAYQSKGRDGLAKSTVERLDELLLIYGAF